MTFEMAERKEELDIIPVKKIIRSITNILVFIVTHSLSIYNVDKSSVVITKVRLHERV